jgi:hypothetical protein
VGRVFKWKNRQPSPQMGYQRSIDLMLRDAEPAKKYVARFERKFNINKALGIFAHKLGRAMYFMLKNKEAFDMKRFFAQ